MAAAQRINPYLAQETIGELISDGLLDKDYYAAVSDYNKAVLAGIVKIASKMGISTIQSYAGSQIFGGAGHLERGHRQILYEHRLRVGGITIQDIQNDLVPAIRKAFDPLGLDINRELPSLGAHKFRGGPLPSSTSTTRRPSTFAAGLLDRQLRYLQAVHRRRCQ